MDLSSLESWATFFRHAIVLFGLGSSIAGLLAFCFGKNNATKQRDYQVPGIILGFFVVGAAALNFDFTDRLAKAKDEQFQRFKLEKDVEIKNMEKENLLLRKGVGRLEESNLKAAKEVAALQVEIATSKRQQAEAEMKLAKLVMTQQPRNLRIKNELIVSRLKSAPRGKAMVWYQQADPESLLFASSLMGDLQEAGWRNMGHKAVPSTIEHGASNGDIDFVMLDLQVFQSKSVQVLLEVLRESGFTVGGGFFDTTVPEDTLRIVIQPKP